MATKLPYYTFSALDDGTIFGVMRTNTNDLELSPDLLHVTFHEGDSEHVLAANTNKQAYRLEQGSDGYAQLVPKEAE